MDVKEKALDKLRYHNIKMKALRSKAQGYLIIKRFRKTKEYSSERHKEQSSWKERHLKWKNLYSSGRKSEKTTPFPPNKLWIQVWTQLQRK